MEGAGAQADAHAHAVLKLFLCALIPVAPLSGIRAMVFAHAFHHPEITAEDSSLTEDLGSHVSVPK
jgi:hypothetical protein